MILMDTIRYIYTFIFVFYFDASHYIQGKRQWPRSLSLIYNFHLGLDTNEYYIVNL